MSKFHLRRVGPPATQRESSNLMCFTRPVTFIGRNPSQVDYVISSSNFVQNAIISRRHARVVRSVDCNSFRIHDDSRNGVFVNNIKIAGAVVLNEGDCVTFGHTMGEKLQPGTWVRQPDSEYQFVFERCECTIPLIHSAQGTALPQLASSISKEPFASSPMSRGSVVNVVPLTVEGGFRAPAPLVGRSLSLKRVSRKSLTSTEIESSSRVVDSANSELISDYIPKNSDTFQAVNSTDLQISEKDSSDTAVNCSASDHASGTVRSVKLSDVKPCSQESTVFDSTPSCNPEEPVFHCSTSNAVPGDGHSLSSLSAGNVGQISSSGADKAIICSKESHPGTSVTPSGSSVSLCEMDSVSFDSLSGSDVRHVLQSVEVFSGLLPEMANAIGKRCKENDGDIIESNVAQTSSCSLSVSMGFDSAIQFQLDDERKENIVKEIEATDHVNVSEIRTEMLSVTEENDQKSVRDEIENGNIMRQIGTEDAVSHEIASADAEGSFAVIDEKILFKGSQMSPSSDEHFTAGNNMTETGDQVAVQKTKDSGDMFACNSAAYEVELGDAHICDGRNLAFDKELILVESKEIMSEKDMEETTDDRGESLGDFAKIRDSCKDSCKEEETGNVCCAEMLEGERNITAENLSVVEMVAQADVMADNMMQAVEEDGKDNVRTKTGLRCTDDPLECTSIYDISYSELTAWNPDLTITEQVDKVPEQKTMDEESNQIPLQVTEVKLAELTNLQLREDATELEAEPTNSEIPAEVLSFEITDKGAATRDTRVEKSTGIASETVDPTGITAGSDTVTSVPVAMICLGPKTVATSGNADRELTNEEDVLGSITKRHAEIPQNEIVREVITESDKNANIVTLCTVESTENDLQATAEVTAAEEHPTSVAAMAFRTAGSIENDLPTMMAEENSVDMSTDPVVSFESSSKETTAEGIFRQESNADIAKMVFAATEDTEGCNMTDFTRTETDNTGLSAEIIATSGSASRDIAAEETGTCSADEEQFSEVRAKEEIETEGSSAEKLIRPKASTETETNITDQTAMQETVTSDAEQTVLRDAVIQEEITVFETVDPFTEDSVEEVARVTTVTEETSALTSDVVSEEMFTVNNSVADTRLMDMAEECELVAEETITDADLLVNTVTNDVCFDDGTPGRNAETSTILAETTASEKTITSENTMKGIFTGAESSFAVVTGDAKDKCAVMDSHYSVDLFPASCEDLHGGDSTLSATKHHEIDLPACFIASAANTVTDIVDTSSLVNEEEAGSSGSGQRMMTTFVPLHTSTPVDNSDGLGQEKTECEFDVERVNLETFSFGAGESTSHLSEVGLTEVSLKVCKGISSWTEFIHPDSSTLAADEKTKDSGSGPFDTSEVSEQVKDNQDPLLCAELPKNGNIVTSEERVSEVAGEMLTAGEQSKGNATEDLIEAADQIPESASGEKEQVDASRGIVGIEQGLPSSTGEKLAITPGEHRGNTTESEDHAPEDGAAVLEMEGNDKFVADDEVGKLETKDKDSEGVNEPADISEMEVVTTTQDEIQIAGKQEDGADAEIATQLEYASELYLATRLEDGADAEIAAQLEYASELYPATRLEDAADTEIAAQLEYASELYPATRLEDGADTEIAAQLEYASELYPATRLEDGADAEIAAQLEYASELYPATRLEDAADTEIAAQLEYASELYPATRLEDGADAEIAAQLEYASELYPATRLEDAADTEIAAQLEYASELYPATRLEDGADTEIAAQLEYASELYPATRLEDAADTEIAAQLEYASELYPATRLEDGTDAEVAAQLEDAGERDPATRLEDGADAEVATQPEDVGEVDVASYPEDDASFEVAVQPGDVLEKETETNVLVEYHATHDMLESSETVSRNAAEEETVMSATLELAEPERHFIECATEEEVCEVQTHHKVATDVSWNDTKKQVEYSAAEDLMEADELVPNVARNELEADEEFPYDASQELFGIENELAEDGVGKVSEIEEHALNDDSVKIMSFVEQVLEDAITDAAVTAEKLAEDENGEILHSNCPDDPSYATGEMVLIGKLGVEDVSCGETESEQHVLGVVCKVVEKDEAASAITTGEGVECLPGEIVRERSETEEVHQPDDLGRVTMKCFFDSIELFAAMEESVVHVSEAATGMTPAEAGVPDNGTVENQSELSEDAVQTEAVLSESEQIVENCGEPSADFVQPRAEISGDQTVENHGGVLKDVVQTRTGLSDERAVVNFIKFSEDALEIEVKLPEEHSGDNTVQLLGESAIMSSLEQPGVMVEAEGGLPEQANELKTEDFTEEVIETVTNSLHKAVLDVVQSDANLNDEEDVTNVVQNEHPFEQPSKDVAEVQTLEEATAMFSSDVISGGLLGVGRGVFIGSGTTIDEVVVERKNIDDISKANATESISEMVSIERDLIMVPKDVVTETLSEPLLSSARTESPVDGSAQMIFFGCSSQQEILKHEKTDDFPSSTSDMSDSDLIQIHPVAERHIVKIEYQCQSTAFENNFQSASLVCENSEDDDNDSVNQTAVEEGQFDDVDSDETDASIQLTKQSTSSSSTWSQAVCSSPAFASSILGGFVRMPLSPYLFSSALGRQMMPGVLSPSVQQSPIVSDARKRKRPLEQDFGWKRSRLEQSVGIGDNPVFLQENDGGSGSTSRNSSPTFETVRHASKPKMESDELSSGKLDSDCSSLQMNSCGNAMKNGPDEDTSVRETVENISVEEGVENKISSVVDNRVDVGRDSLLPEKTAPVVNPDLVETVHGTQEVVVEDKVSDVEVILEERKLEKEAMESEVCGLAEDDIIGENREECFAEEMMDETRGCVQQLSGSGITMDELKIEMENNGVEQNESGVCVEKEFIVEDTVTSTSEEMTNAGIEELTTETNVLVPGSDIVAESLLETAFEISVQAEEHSSQQNGEKPSGEQVTMECLTDKTSDEASDHGIDFAQCEETDFFENCSAAIPADQSDKPSPLVFDVPTDGRLDSSPAGCAVALEREGPFTSTQYPDAEGRDKESLPPSSPQFSISGTQEDIFAEPLLDDDDEEYRMNSPVPFNDSELHPASVDFNLEKASDSVVPESLQLTGCSVNSDGMNFCTPSESLNLFLEMSQDVCTQPRASQSEHAAVVKTERVCDPSVTLDSTMVQDGDADGRDTDVQNMLNVIPNKCMETFSDDSDSVEVAPVDKEGHGMAEGHGMDEGHGLVESHDMDNDSGSGAQDNCADELTRDEGCLTDDDELGEGCSADIEPENYESIAPVSDAECCIKDVVELNSMQFEKDSMQFEKESDGEENIGIGNKQLNDGNIAVSDGEQTDGNCGVTAGDNEKDLLLNCGDATCASSPVFNESNLPKENEKSDCAVLAMKDVCSVDVRNVRTEEMGSSEDMMVTKDISQSACSQSTGKNLADLLPSVSSGNNDIKNEDNVNSDDVNNVNSDDVNNDIALPALSVTDFVTGTETDNLKNDDDDDEDDDGDDTQNVAGVNDDSVVSKEAVCDDHVNSHSLDVREAPRDVECIDKEMQKVEGWQPENDESGSSWTNELTCTAVNTMQLDNFNVICSDSKVVESNSSGVITGIEASITVSNFETDSVRIVVLNQNSPEQSLQPLNIEDPTGHAILQLDEVEECPEDDSDLSSDQRKGNAGQEESVDKNEVEQLCTSLQLEESCDELDFGTKTGNAVQGETIPTVDHGTQSVNASLLLRSASPDFDIDSPKVIDCSSSDESASKAEHEEDEDDNDEDRDDDDEDKDDDDEDKDEDDEDNNDNDEDNDDGDNEESSRSSSPDIFSCAREHQSDADLKTATKIIDTPAFDDSIDGFTPPNVDLSCIDSDDDEPTLTEFPMADVLSTRLKAFSRKLASDSFRQQMESAAKSHGSDILSKKRRLSDPEIDLADSKRSRNESSPAVFEAEKDTLGDFVVPENQSPITVSSASPGAVTISSATSDDVSVSNESPANLYSQSLFSQDQEPSVSQVIKSESRRRSEVVSGVLQKIKSKLETETKQIELELSGMETRCSSPEPVEPETESVLPPASDANEINSSKEKSIFQSYSAIVKELKTIFQNDLPGIKSQRLLSWKNEVSAMESVQSLPKTIIAVVGETGAGKSSLLNALLDHADVLPTSGMRACTAVVVQVADNPHSSNYEAEIEFLSEKEWTEELQILLKELTGRSGKVRTHQPDLNSDSIVAWSKIRAVYGTFSNSVTLEELSAQRTVTRWLGKTKRIIHTLPRDFKREIDRYIESRDVGSGGDYWPIVKLVRTRIPNCGICSSGAVLVDMPGMGDSNAARNNIAKHYMQNCNSVWVVSNIHRAVDNKIAKDLLGEHFRRQLLMDGQYSSVSFICTKTDIVNTSETISELQMDGECDVLLNEVSDLEEKILRREIESKKVTKRMNFLNEKINALKKERISLSTDVEELTQVVEDEEEIDDEVSDTLTQLQQTVASKDEILQSANMDVESLRITEVNYHKEVTDWNRQIRWKRRQLRELCAKARNEYSTRQIRRDFRAGIKEVQKKTCQKAGNAAAASDDEMDGDDDDDDDGNDDDDESGGIGKIAENLKVFCVSSTEYLKLTGKLKKDGPAEVFQSVEDTGIPAVVNYAHTLTRVRRKQGVERLGKSLGRFVFEVLSYVSDAGTKDHDTREAAEVIFIEFTAQLRNRFTQIMSEIDQQIGDLFRQQLLPKIDLGVQSAVSSAPATVVKWGTKSNKENRTAGGLPWSTYKATTSRSGIFRSPTYGPIDFNEDLAGPMYDALTVTWNKIFNCQMSTILDNLKRNTLTAVKKFCEDLQLELDRVPVDSTHLARIKQQVITSSENRLSEAVVQLKDFVTQRQRDVNRVIMPSIQTDMQPAYSYCRSEVGQGLFQRMKTAMSDHIDLTKQTMMDQAASKITEQLWQLQAEIELRLNDVFELLIQDLSALYEPIWESRNPLLLQRPKFITDILGLKHQMFSFFEKIHFSLDAPELLIFDKTSAFMAAKKEISPMVKDTFNARKLGFGNKSLHSPKQPIVSAHNGVNTTSKVKLEMLSPPNSQRSKLSASSNLPPVKVEAPGSWSVNAGLVTASTSRVGDVKSGLHQQTLSHASHALRQSASASSSNPLRLGSHPDALSSLTSPVHFSGMVSNAADAVPLVIKQEQTSPLRSKRKRKSFFYGDIIDLTEDDDDNDNDSSEHVTHLAKRRRN